jgi:hypothetical protein
LIVNGERFGHECLNKDAEHKCEAKAGVQVSIAKPKAIVPAAVFVF